MEVPSDAVGTGTTHGDGEADTLSGGWAAAGRRATVFLSYAHESPAHKADVRCLYDLLVQSGVEPILDQVHEQQVDEGNWALWTRRQVDLADFVLVIASPGYKRRSDAPDEVPRNVGRGVWWEADYLRGHIYDDKGKSYRRIFPVVLPGSSEVFMPATMFRPDHPVFRIAELTALGVHELAEVLCGRAPVPWPEELPRAGWIFAGPEGREGVQGHVQRLGRGQRSVSRGGDLFRGRHNALKMVTEWLQAGRPPGQVLVVTGQPGAGKSTVVARTALDLEPEAIRTGRRLGLVFHARSATLLDFLHAVAVATGTDAAESVEQMIANVSQAGPPVGLWWRVVVDGLDEVATSVDRNHLVQALAELAALPFFRVVVATRALSPSPADQRESHRLLVRLGVNSPTAPNLVDLDTDRYFDPLGLLDFISALLLQDGAVEPGPSGRAWQTYRADQTLCRRLAAAIAGRAGRNYLAAALTADTLSKQVDLVDPAASGFTPASLPTSVGEALGKYFESLQRGQGDELRAVAEQARIRGLLTALAYARGPGLTDENWIAFANSLGRPANMGDLDALRLGTVADFLLQTSTVHGERVTRLFHQALVDELLASRPRASDESKILAVLAPTGPAAWREAAHYPVTYAAEHAVAAGRLGLLLDDATYPTVADLARLLPLLAAERASGHAPVIGVLRAAGARAHQLSPARRAGLFALTAAQLGLSHLAGRFHWQGNPAVRWAHSRGSAHLTITGHTDRVTAVALGRVGGRDIIVSGSNDATVRMWDAQTGQPIGDPIQGHTSKVTAVALGRVAGRDIIVSGSNDATVRMWDAQTGQPVGSPLAHNHRLVNAVAIGRIAGKDVIVSGSSVLWLWDDASRSTISPFNDPRPNGAHEIDRVGDAHITGSDGGHTVRVWDPDTGEPIGFPLKGSAPIGLSQVAGRDVIFSGDGSSVRMWDPSTGQPIGAPIKGHTGTVTAFALGQVSGRDVLVSGDGSSVRMWDPSTGQPIGAPYDGHTGTVTAIALGQISGRDVIVSGSRDAVVRLWDAQTGEPVGDPLHGHISEVTAVAVGRVGDRDLIVSAGTFHDPTVRIWDPVANVPVGMPIKGHNSLVTAVAIGRMNDRDVVVSGGADRTMRVWDANAGRPHGYPVEGHGDVVTAVAVARFGRHDVVISGCGDINASPGGDYSVRVWDTIPDMHAASRLQHDAPVVAVAVGRANGRNLIVSGSADGMVALCTYHSGRLRCQALFSAPRWVTAVAVGQAGGQTLVVAGSRDAVIQRWNADTRKPVGPPITGHTAAVRSVAVGRAGGQHVIVSASDDATVRVWDALTGQPVGFPLRGHTAPIAAIAMGQIGTRDVIISGSHDRTLRVWDSTTGTTLSLLDTLDPITCLAADAANITFTCGTSIAVATLTAHDGN